ncbi:hypothetical protein SUS17_3694 [Sphingomonas sp. S17]|jgi:hypothetical protein|uniref:Uncharacterized protein n=3 Tax=Pseudomonadati TaxID=3379134 RepID=A0A399SGW5_9BACT|nr:MULTISPECIES: hypothetical protein [Sphingomonas]RIJ43376.1 hypothetical protein D1614_25190 [Maribellus luteus]EGI53487.1 hypothetical protein SUS17_3694 [Sphingomonas sp. S17]MBQ1478791.1 hypothetical protein [Sphingomonas sp.]MCM3678284.1 hypothetical protein [Sphingomonas paucimobilis]MDG5972922.1 hypothetical protein [Sphingomonas paucimobilis]
MTEPMQATGKDGKMGDAKKGAPDGVSDAPGKHGGESQGGGYEGVPERKGDFHGGQSETAYHGSGGHPDPDKDNPNAVTDEG